MNESDSLSLVRAIEELNHKADRIAIALEKLAACVDKDATGVGLNVWNNNSSDG